MEIGMRASLTSVLLAGKNWVRNGAFEFQSNRAATNIAYIRAGSDRIVGMAEIVNCVTDHESQ
jgi:hypothetical protein